MESLKQEEKSAFAEGVTQTKHHRTRTFDLYNLRLCAAAEESATGVYGMAMRVLGLEKSDLVREVKDVLGVATFLEISEGGRTLFI